MDDINNNLQNEVDGKSDNNSSDEDEVFFSTYLYLMIYLIHCGLFRLELSFLLLLFCSTRLTKSRTGSNCPLFQTQCYITHFSPMFHFYTLENVRKSLLCLCTEWKVSKYGVFSSPYFPVFGPEKTPCLGAFQAVLAKLSLIILRRKFTNFSP